MSRPSLTPSSLGVSYAFTDSVNYDDRKTILIGVGEFPLRSIGSQ